MTIGNVVELTQLELNFAEILWPFVAVQTIMLVHDYVQIYTYFYGYRNI